jgi:hypothetical protein
LQTTGHAFDTPVRVRAFTAVPLEGQNGKGIACGGPTGHPCRPQEQQQMRLRAAILLPILLLQMASAQATGLLDRQANRLPDIADQDNGGNLLQRIQFVEAHRNDPIYRLPVECFSSCTLLLGIAGACVSQGSILYFHAASVDGKPAPEYLNTYVESYYPPAIRHWVITHKVLEKMQFTPLDWREAASLGVKVCQ